MLDLRQWLRSGVLVQEDPNVCNTSLHTVNGFPVRSADSTGFDGVDLVDEAVRLIGQLTNDIIPLGKALMTAVAVWEDSRESTGADIAARPRHAVHTHTVTIDFVTLQLRDATRVAVTC